MAHADTAPELGLPAAAPGPRITQRVRSRFDASAMATLIFWVENVLECVLLLTIVRPMRAVSLTVFSFLYGLDEFQTWSSGSSEGDEWYSEDRETNCQRSIL